MQNATDPNTEPVQRPSTPDGLREFTGTPPDQESLHHYGDAIDLISNLLLEDLLRWDAEGLQVHPFAIRPAMFGKSEADARLWVVVCCDERLHRHAKRFFNKRQVRELFEPPERPEVDFKVYIAKSVIPLARPVAQMPASVIHGFAHNNELCGAPLWLFNPDTSAARQVTLGGVLKVTVDGREQCFGMTLGHAVDELEDITTQKMGVEPEADHVSAVEPDSSDAESSESGTSSSLGEEDLQIGSQIEPPRNQERENPWASNSVMLTMDKATANPETGAYYDWALVDLGNLPNHLEVYNEGARRVDGQRLLPLVPSSQDIDNAQGSAVVVTSSEGPKSGTISFFPSKLLLSPGRAFVDTYIVHLAEPYVFSRGDSGSWVMNSESGHVYGHLVVTDILGAGHVMPILDTLHDIKSSLGATDVAFPGLPGRQPASEAAESASLPPRYAPYRPQPSSREIPIIVSDNENRIVFELFSPQNTEAAHVAYRHKDRPPDLMVCSPPLLYALRSVIRYYPELELTKESPMFGWPYPALVHHYDELKDCAAEWEARTDDRATCLLKRDIPEHVRFLLEYLDTTIMAQVREEKERNRRGMYTFDLAWLSQKPGTTIVYDKDDAYLPRRPAFPATPHGGDWPGSILSPGPFVVLPSRPEAPVAHLDVEGWTMEYNGHELGRVMYGARILPFSGSRERPWRVLEPASWEEDYSSDDFSDSSESEATRQPLPSSMPSSFDVTDSIENGRAYWDVVPQTQCRRFTGCSADYPQIEINSIVVIDHQQALKEHPQEGIPPLMSDLDLAAWYPPRCPCDACNNEHGQEGERELNDRQPHNKEGRDFEDYCRIEPGPGRMLTPHQYLLCPSSTWAFVLNTRSWQKLPVRDLRPLTWKHAPMDDLVMDEARKRFVLRLVEAKRRRSGLVLHLYGGPGLGKTFTAECVAAHCRTPLETLSSSDVVDHPSAQHKTSMMDVIRAANRWKTILHFVDADGLLAERASSSGVGGSSVAESFRGAFRDALGSSKGLVILETNRLDDLSEDIASKTHARVHYPPFSEPQRRKVWDTMCDSYADQHIHFDDAARGYISTPRVKALKWNGSDMRRVIEGAVALTERGDKAASTWVGRQELEVMVELSGNGSRSSTATHPYRFLRLGTRTNIIIVLATAVVGILLLPLTASWGSNLQLLQS